MCGLCDHGFHGSDSCEYVVGYDHLNGDHECGCPGYTAVTELADELGVSYRQLDYWIRTEYLGCMRDGIGSGYPRMMTPQECEVARVMVRIMRAGLTPSAASVAARRMVTEEDTATTLPNDVLIVLLPERTPGGSSGN